jgi:hypothetical protein
MRVFNGDFEPSATLVAAGLVQVSSDRAERVSHSCVTNKRGRSQLIKTCMRQPS